MAHTWIVILWRGKTWMTFHCYNKYTWRTTRTRLALFPADLKSAVVLVRLGQHPVERLAKEIDSAAKALPPTRSTRLEYWIGFEVTFTSTCDCEFDGFARQWHQTKMQKLWWRQQWCILGAARPAPPLQERLIATGNSASKTLRVMSFEAPTLKQKSRP